VSENIATLKISHVHLFGMSNIKKVAVLGSGVMGHGIAQVSAAAGYSVALRDIEESFLQKAMDRIKWSLAKLVEKKN
jgi:enoyl-CoA hydratase / 3-hydroxyacyl-CoA dehydrogenase